MAAQLAVRLRQGDGQAREAVEALVRDGEAEPNKRDFIGVAALIYLQAGQNALAAETYQKAVKFQPKRAVYYADMALAYYRLGKLAEALAAGQRSVELDPNDPLNQVNLARYYGQRREIAKAVELAQRAFALAQQQGDTDTALLAQLLAALLPQLERASQREVAELIKQSRGNLATAESQGNHAAAEQQRDLLHLMEAFDRSSTPRSSKATAAPPATKVPTRAGSGAAHRLRLRNGNMLEGTISRQNDQEVAISVAGVGEVVFTRAEVVSVESLSGAEAQPKRLPNSAVLMAEVARQPTVAPDPKEPVIVLMRQVQGADFSYVIPVSVALSAAEKLEAAGEREQALDVYQTILASEPNNIFAVQRLKVLQAADARSSAGAARAASASALEAKALIQQALADLGALDLKGAEQKLRQAVAVDPKSAEAHFQLSVIYAAHDDHQKSFAEMEEAVALDPANPIYLYQLGLQQAQLNQLEAARATVSKALALPDPSGQPGLDRGSMTLASRLFLLLEAAHRKAGDGDAVGAHAAFDGRWLLRTTRVERVELLGRSAEAAAQRQQELQATLVGQERPLPLQQDGQLLHTPGRLGFVSGRRFAYGERLQGDTPEGCIVTILMLFAGEMSAAGTLEGEEILEASPDHPEKCPEASMLVVTKFTGTKQAAR